MLYFRDAVDVAPLERKDCTTIRAYCLALRRPVSGFVLRLTVQLLRQYLKGRAG